jgi:O-succinylbenzoate synthase
MHISQITVYHLSMPLRSPFETSFGRSVYRECLLLEVMADGVSGYGECVADQTRAILMRPLALPFTYCGTS